MDVGVGQRRLLLRLAVRGAVMRRRLLLLRLLLLGQRATRVVHVRQTHVAVHEKRRRIGRQSVDGAVADGRRRCRRRSRRRRIFGRVVRAVSGRTVPHRLHQTLDAERVEAGRFQRRSVASVVDHGAADGRRRAGHRPVVTRLLVVVDASSAARVILDELVLGFAGSRVDAVGHLLLGRIQIFRLAFQLAGRHQLIDVIDVQLRVVMMKMVVAVVVVTQLRRPFQSALRVDSVGQPVGLVLLMRLLPSTGSGSVASCSQDVLLLEHFLLLLEGVFFLEATTSPQVGAVVEHVVRVGIQRPVGSLSGLLVVPGHFDETFVEAQVVADRVLPALLVLAVIREPVHDELVDAVERDLLLGRTLNGHGDEGDVRVRRLDHVLDRRLAVARIGRVRIIPTHSGILFVAVSGHVGRIDSGRGHSGRRGHGRHHRRHRLQISAVSGGCVSVVGALVAEERMHVGRRLRQHTVPPLRKFRRWITRTCRRRVVNGFSC